MVMDYMPGGDLLSGILDNESLLITEELIRFYTAEIILAIEALHNMGFAHRDIKPDNCLINAKGNLYIYHISSNIGRGLEVFYVVISRHILEEIQ